MKIDARNNLLSVLLLGGIGAAALIGGLNFLLLGRADADRIEAAAEDLRGAGQARSPDPQVGDLERYSVITERPVFFEDRQLPVVETGEAGDEEELAEAPVVEQAPELEATVAGIIITPDLRLAMVSTGRNRSDTMVLSEGMALEGEFSAWKLEEIQERSVRFATESGRSANLELIVETDSLASGQPARPAQQASEPAAEPGSNAALATGADTEAQAAARARAEEIRRRVAERRAQLRAEAERRAREQQDNDGR